MTTLLSLEIFSRDRWLLRAIKGGGFEINLLASLSLSRNSMRDKVNIDMYLVYLCVGKLSQINKDRFRLLF